MKILHIVSSYWPAFEFGGPIQSVHILNKFLIKKGIDITVYTTNAGLRNKDIVVKKQVDLDGVKVFYFPYFGYVHFTFSLSLFWAIKKNIKNFDLIHITGVWNFPVFAAAFWARFYKKPYIISPRGSLMKEPLVKKKSFLKKILLFLTIKKFFEKATAIHFTVEAEKEEYLKAGLNFKQAFIIPNSLHLEEFKKFNWDVGEFRKKFKIAIDAKIILSLGRINWKKGFDTLIPAFAEIIKKEPKAVLLIVGPDNESYKKEIELEIKKQNLKIGKNIIFTEELINDEKITAYKTANVFVLPSYSENFGMAVAEAMYMNLPVVITENVGISSFVSRVKAGFVVKKDERQISEAILKILNNPNLAKEMGKVGRQTVEKEFSSSEIAEKFIKEYYGIINI
ncbi:glycosyltransferase [Candidatus Wolfebacteria bacterium]|nr:glycosyltransferase [Candidatus Wolfebacteria bacterium]